MEDLPWKRQEKWSLDQSLEQLASNGFSGIGVDLGAQQKPEPEVLTAALRGSDLETAVFAFVSSDADLTKALRYAEKIDAREMVVCGQVFDPQWSVAVDHVNRWFNIADNAGVRMQLETHRNTLTNDFRFTADHIVDLDPRVKLALDLSHYVCGSELPSTPTPEIEGRMDRLFERAGSIQGRIASRCQVQIPISYPGHEEWSDLFKNWWTRAFSRILEKNPASDVLFVTELGTTPYAMTDRHGEELSDRWQEALILKRWAHEAFAVAQGRLLLAKDN